MKRNSIKAKIIIISWLTSLMFMATDNIVQALIAFCFFGLSSFLLEKCKQEVNDEITKLNKWFDRKINKQPYK